MYEMVAGHPPFRAKTLKDLNRKILNDKVLLPKFLSSEVRRISRQHFPITSPPPLPQQGHTSYHTRHAPPSLAVLFHELLPLCLYMQAHAVLKGFLERNVQKRLGGSKSTMFEVGGVAAIKAHRWFGKIPWNNLLRKQGKGDTHRFANPIVCPTGRRSCE